jgi:hypothetical protein
MGRSGALGVCTGLLCLAAAATADAAHRGAYFSPGGSAPRAPEIMLYFSHSVGGGAGAGGSMRPTFGLRVQQIHQAANTGDPEQGESMQHREILNWQFDGNSNLRLSQTRVKLGNRLTYDFANSRFGSPSRSLMKIGTPSLRTALVNPGAAAYPVGVPNPGTAVNPAGVANPAGAAKSFGARPFAAPNPTRSFASISSGRESSRDNSNMHEIAAAAMAALAPARFTSAQRQVAQRHGGITAIAGAQRMQNATALR